MKKFIYTLRGTLCIAIMVLCFNTKGYAQAYNNINFSLWGGMSLGEDDGYIPIGVKGHYNIALGQSLELGLGVFFYYPLVGINRTAAGLNVALIYRMSRFSPYLRATYALYDDLSSEYDKVDKKGNGLGIGLGAEFAVTNSIRLFAEFMYDFRGHERYEGGTTSRYVYGKSNYIASINLGVTYLIDMSGEREAQREKERIERGQPRREQAPRREQEQRRAW